MAIVIHTINGSQYAYNHHRVGNKVVCDYIGKVGGSEGGGGSAPVHVSGELTQQPEIKLSLSERLKQYVKEKEGLQKEIENETHTDNTYKLDSKDIDALSKMTEDTFKNNPPDGFVYSKGYGSEEAMLLPNGKIALTSKFFELDKQTREHTLQHEEGHRWEGNVITPENYWKIFDSGIFGNQQEGIFGSSTKHLHEPMAEARAVYIDSPEELKTRHPAAYHFILEIDAGKTWEQGLATAKQYPYTTRKENYELSFDEYKQRYHGVSYSDHRSEIIGAIRKGKPVSKTTRNLYDLSGYDLTPKEK